MHTLEHKRTSWFQRKPKPRKKILVLVDFENLIKNISSVSLSLDSLAARPSLIEGFDNLMQWLGEIGKIVNVFAFAPPHCFSLFSETLHRLGFISVLCPKVKDKEGNEVDTADQSLVNFGKMMVSQIPDLDYLCVITSDKDFIPFSREMIRQGLEIIFVTGGNINSLSPEFIDFANRFGYKHPLTGQRINLFLPAEQ